MNKQERLEHIEKEIAQCRKRASQAAEGSKEQEECNADMERLFTQYRKAMSSDE